MMKKNHFLFLGLLTVFTGTLVWMTPGIYAASTIKKVEKKITASKLKSEKREVGNDQQKIKTLTTAIQADQARIKMDAPNSKALAKDRKKLQRDQKALMKAQQALAKDKMDLTKAEQTLKQGK